MGGLDAKLYVYDVGELSVPREQEWDDLQEALKKLADRENNFRLWDESNKDGNPSTSLE